MSSSNTAVDDGGGGGSSGSGSSIEVEYNEIVSQGGWNSVFQDIRQRSERQAQAKDFSTNESKKLDNRRLNRYRDVLPYDHSRVALKRGENDYINANLVKMERASRKYILCQGPLPLTIGHFWLMVWEHDSRAILMLNKLIEQTTVKCHQYWPSKIGEKHRLELTDVKLSVVYLKCVEYKNFCRRTFRLTDTESGKSREVIQFHYMTWPDFGIPSSPVAFLQFLKEVRGSGTLDSDVGPPIIHCSAGIGRSGTFCLVDCCLVLIDKEGEDRVSVQDVLLELRQYRMGLIQTADQLYFSYQAIIEGMKRMNNSSFEDFEELSVISSSSQPNSDHDTEENEDTPPPLPPPRTFSLKPLPTIPTSESVHEDFLLMNNGDREKFTNMINLEKSKQFESGGVVDESNNHHHHSNNHRNSQRHSSNHYHPYSNRPLPPVVREKPLCKVNESDSDGGGGGGGRGSESNGASGSNSSGNSSADEELIEENDSDLNGDEEDEEQNNKELILDGIPSDGHSDTVKSSLLDDSSTATTTTSSSTTTTSSTGGGGGTSSSTSKAATTTGMMSSTSYSTSSSTTASAIGSNNSTLESNRGGGGGASAEVFNANSSLPPLPNGAVDDGDEMISSPERELSPNASELRRRKRTERHTAMEEKIREIKRKQKEVESKGSPKKRRKQKESEK
ncbi:tyrosine-protein phosphatase non-receptor type 61F [Anopheles ziemanni]|uniref:tyrosine-protein phosphatase non-receptor type 61F n=1 Tax=Anopheles ziemanni TaxID=345580 RepID=UPI00265B5037|nr:tyrosine-protein phosphatase non-receptor type 61F isoform X2 [Anopheles coustani]XP_058167909.1 tyrosine-protein phosphatase non-receptor type 61F [Anopheles ziemanni]